MERERLINADVFEKFIKEKYADGEKAEDIKEQMLFDLSCQPTAYDVDKVIERLEIEKNPIYREDGSLMAERAAIGIDKAIEIVKGGGVDGN